MSKEKILQIFKILTATIPNPTTDLVYHSNFELLIAVILSARTTDITINKIIKKLYKVANTPEQIVGLGLEKVKKYIKSSGFFNSKAKNIVKTCQILIEKYDSQVPENREDLESLPGVGRKTANVVMNIAFGKPTIAVDTHVFRVSNRTGIAKGKTPEAVEKKLLKIVPKKFGKTAGSLLLLHGRYTCTSQKPKCKICPILKLCTYKNKNL